MRIAYCTNELWKGGGTERVLTTKVNWLCRQKGIEVYVIALQDGRQPFFKLDDAVRLVELPVGTMQKKAYAEALKKALDDIDPDVTVAVSGLAVDVLPEFRWPCVMEFHYTRNFLVNFVRGIRNLRFKPLHVLKMRYLQWILARKARKFDRFVGLTERDVELWGHPKNMTYVHNPLSFRSERKSDCKKKVIISVGSWTPAKGMDRLLEAFGPLSALYPDWRVELYGSGQDEALLKEIIRNYGMESRVTLNAPVKNIGERLVEASIYAFPSRSDGFGLVITEAMECGLPTVAMDCPCGPCEIVTSRTGIVVPNDDVDAFRTALKRLMDDPDLRMSMGQEAVKEVARFYPDSIMPKWLDIFKGVNARHQ